MSLPRSIDMSDLGGASIAISSTAETLIVAGPRLQTPKDTSVIVILASLYIGISGGATNLTAKIRLGPTLAGAQVGQTYNSGSWATGSNVPLAFMVPMSVSATDYVQVCLTLQCSAVTGTNTVAAGTLLCMSF